MSLRNAYRTLTKGYKVNFHRKNQLDLSVIEFSKTQGVKLEKTCLIFQNAIHFTLAICSPRHFFYSESASDIRQN